MSERLRTMNVPADSPVGELVAALSSWQPLDASPERRARLLANVLERGRPGRLVVGLFRPAVALIAVLSLGMATAAATVGPRLQRRWFPDPPVDPPVVGIDEPIVLRPMATPSRPRPALVAEPEPQRRTRASRSESPARLVAAVRALRVEDQPLRAEQLALGYLRVYPHGALAEEALAVAIEAAALNHDSRAPRLAERYFRQYPNGRFRHVAEQAQSPRNSSSFSGTVTGR